MSRRKSVEVRQLGDNAGKRRLQVHPRQRNWRRPSCPDWMPAEGKREFRRVTRELEELGLLAAADRATIVAYCLAWARMVEAERAVTSEGVLIEGYRGSTVKHPGLQVARDSRAGLMAAAKELGLTPRAREGMSIDRPDDDEDEDLLR